MDGFFKIMHRQLSNLVVDLEIVDLSWNTMEAGVIYDQICHSCAAYLEDLVGNNNAYRVSQGYSKGIG